MQDSDLRLFAVEAMKQIQDLLVHRGSAAALLLAGEWADGQAVDEAVLAKAREAAARDAEHCTAEVRDGRNHAAEAACHLLAPNAGQWMQVIIDCIAKAKAARYVFNKYGNESSSATESYLDYVRAIEAELLQDWLERWCKDREQRSAMLTRQRK
jgi:hypothetical protein